ncbi:hypothetical protein GP475_00335 [Corynebacterium poyangense]|uniref:Uncharacterized protein n=1 Tax=Corynebacterium poyangense TaxID=2684405 RepID=A0A7H0SL22_9CORY|nr:hypothetical protein [Corynebacterium poyangense]MBZ8177334.1 hypothetical protein [Corynebacterium poyangense]QNQ89247.1 hypothetical protein GP475_00335 [Corynebacterium poyangense]
MSRFRRFSVAAAVALITTLTPAVANADEHDYGAAYMIFSCKTYHYPWCRD